ncbi:hypothetical protein BGZ60DRAFT_32805 [Tricladium varicosporioides]|nr:hypothetical protein BGZ60DRAFT_32805 [Hymenoscyphus varicosporioides]
MTESSPPPSTRRFSPTPVETTTKKVRRFAPEPVETTIRSSKKEDVPADEMAVDKKDFAQPKRRFLPEPVETTFKSNKQTVPLPPPTPEPTPRILLPENPLPEETPKPRRKFTPELIETSKRSKKAGDRRPATLPTDKTDLTPGIPNIYTRQKRRSPRPQITSLPVPSNTPLGSSPSLSAQIPPLPPRRQPSMRPHPNTRRSTRQNSFQPELDDIPQEEKEDSEEEEYDDEEEEEGTPSLSGSYGSSDDSMRLQLARTRESCDDRFSGYLLALAAKAAEKQLREQALAAFPNESSYEIVEHFYDREIDTTSDEEVIEGIGMLLDEPKLMRRKSTEVGWAAKEMQQHQEKLNRMREEETNKKIADEATKPTFKDPFWTNGMTAKLARGAQDEPIDPKREAELNRMRSAASPPMLGADLKFRMCPSPKATKFESDQRHDVQPNRCENGGGLWGGYCVAGEPGEVLSPSQTKQPAFIHTPHAEHEDPFSSAFASRLPPPTPKANGHAEGVRMIAGIDERLKAEVEKAKQEAALLEEFNDDFVTQVYNYLSLGYPSLARPYDEELARISRIAPDDLRIDDGKKNAKGHIGLVDAPGVSANGNENGCKKEQPKCARWKALRIYILEWGRQHPSMSNGAATPSAWGVRARRGSWAI